MADDTTFQLVTFKLGHELYGVNIMEVKEIVKLQNVRLIPNAPLYVEGIINLRGEIIPIIDLHKRFRIQKLPGGTNELEAGFIILNIENYKIGIMIDKVVKVVSYSKDDIKEPPQMVSGIGTEYIEGVIREGDVYLIMLNTRKLFDPKELEKISVIR